MGRGGDEQGMEAENGDGGGGVLNGLLGDGRIVAAAAVALLPYPAHIRKLGIEGRKKEPRISMR